MKKILLFLMVVAVSWLIAGIVSAGQKDQGGYDPAVTYAGYYQSDVLYVKNSGSKIIQAIPHFDRLNYVKCSDALDHLSRDGKWQGHLKPDGSCGSYDEPAQYTLGNRLNYDNPYVKD